MELAILLAFVCAAIAAAVLTPFTIALARHLGLMDRPDSRKVHTTPIPRLAGIAITLGMLLAGSVAAIYLESRGEFAPLELRRQLLSVTVAGMFVFLVGLVDDVRTVSSSFKLLTLVTASMMVCGAGATFDGLLFGGERVVEFAWLAWLVTPLWIIGITVAISFIDGLDGLAASVTFLASVILAIFLVLSGNPAAAILPLSLCGALAGFLYWNWHPAKTFMGDSGSLTIGFVIACAAVIANPLVGTMRGIVIPALALSVPITDAALTMFRRRYQQRRSIFSAEQGHIHHRLLERGMTQRQAVITILVVSLLAVVIGLMSLQLEGWGTLGGLSLIFSLLWGTFRLAGSIRTNEMLSALRQKRNIDRRSRHYRTCFETLQLEFNRVEDFAGWWQAVCRSADRLEFISVTIPVRSRDDSIRTLQWKSTDDSFAECTKLTATVPIADRRSGFEPLSASVEIASVSSLESAGERLALFSRLMQDHSLASLEKKTVASSTSGMRASGVVANQTRRDPNKFLPPEQLGPFGSLRVAIVHDFLYTYAGAERVVEQLIELFPHSDLFALFDFLDEEDRHFLRGKTVSTSFLQHMPLIRRNHRMYLPLMPLSVEQLDVSQYDLVVSSSYLAAKGVLTGPDQLHICYCHSPARYAWDLQHQYLNESGLGFGAKGMLARTILHYLRSWDVRSALGVDFFIANSKFVARRIDKVYRRDAVVVYPPVDTNYFTPSSDRREDYYVAVGRLVPYKQTELIVAAFNLMPDQKLKIIGDGPDLDKVRHLAGPNVEILGYQDNDFVRHHVQHAKALIFAAEEDFGIVPVEAMACGTPVIAYAKGGVVETVVDGKCGVLFAEQSANSIRDAVREFEDTAFDYDLAQCELHRHAERFSEERFVGRMTDVIGQWVMQKWPDQAALHRRRDTPILVNPASGFDTSGASTTPPWMTAANSAETNGHH